MKMITLVLAGSLLLVAGCGAEPDHNSAEAEPQSKPREPVEINQTFTAGQTQFATNLFHQVFTEHGMEKNIHVSPYSVQLALLLTANALAEPDRQVILETLQIDELELEDINQETQSLIQALSNLPYAEIETANSIWHQPHLKIEKSYQNMLKESLVGEIHEIPGDNPEAAINKWVEKNTNGFIDKLIDEVPTDIISYLINAVYLDANWQMAFDESQTSTEPFHLLNGETIEHPMMNQQGEYLFYENETFEALKIPYEDEGLTMSIILPDVSKFEEVINEFDGTVLWSEDWTHEQVDLSLPTFSYEADYSLMSPLKAVGMESVLLKEIDFSPLFGPNASFPITDVLHKTYIHVDEEGTEAAAATAVVVTVSAVMSDKVFTVDRPFIFAITDEVTETILFMGTVIEPVLNE